MEGQIDGDDEVLKKNFHKQRKRAVISLIVGLVLEVAATLWTLSQAVSDGVFKETPDCATFDYYIKYFNDYLPQNCEQVEFSDVLIGNDDTGDTMGFSSCSTLQDPQVENLCVYPLFYEFTEYRGECFWITARFDNGVCSIMPVEYGHQNDNANDLFLFWGYYRDITKGYFDSMSTGAHSNVPSGVGKLVIGLVVVSLGLEIVEALVGYMCLKDMSSIKSGPMLLASSILESAGILAVLYLMVVRSSYGVDLYSAALDDTDIEYHVLEIAMYMVLVSTCLGVLAEIIAFSREQCSRSCSGRFSYYLGALGNVLIWLGSALLEVIVALYLKWRMSTIYLNRTTPNAWSDLGEEISGLIVVEVMGLIAVWLARVSLMKASSIFSRMK